MSNSNEDRLTGRIKHDKQEYKSYSAKREVQIVKSQLYRRRHHMHSNYKPKQYESQQWRPLLCS